MVTFEETADDDDHDCRYDSYDAEERQAMGLGANQLLVVQLLDKHSGDVARVVGELLG
jgi:hypothetical protein